MKKYCPQCSQKYDDRKLRFCPQDGTPLSLPEPPPVGSTLDHRYRLDSLVGRGGFGLVYCAHHLGLNRRVAFKILKPDVAWECPPAVELFEKEAQMAAHLRHENIVEIFDAGRIGEISYIAMEWLDGRTLDEELEACGQLSFERTAEILRQVAAALAVAHAKRTVHRDLKPSNVMIVKRPDGGEQVKVVDFGVAKVLSSTLGSDVSRAMGTPNYASPEQLKYGAQIDERADIYALGVMLYEMLTVQLPFNAPSVEELIQLKLTSAPQPLRDLLPDAPAAVEGLLLRMIAADPQQRPQKVSEVPALFEAAYKITEPVATAPGTVPAYKMAEPVATAPGAVPVLPAPQAPTMIDPVENSTGSGSDRLGKEPARPQPDEVRPLQPPPKDMAEEETRQRVRVPEAPPKQKPIEPVEQRPEPAEPRTAPPPVIHRPVPPDPPRTLRKRGVAVVVSVFVVALLGTGWWLIWHQKSKLPDPMVPSPTPAALVRAEVLRYSLELEGEGRQRVTGLEPLAADQGFQFYFTPRKNGYLYLIAPGEGTVPTAFLVQQLVTVGQDFQFPPGETPLHDGMGARFTVIFASAPIAALDFLRALRPLTPNQQRVLESFRQQQATAAVETTADKDGVKVTALAGRGEAVVFDIVTSHRKSGS